MARGWRTWLVGALCGVTLILAGCDGGGNAPFHGTDISGTTGWGRDFALRDPQGQVRRLADFSGRAVVLFFGYTHCPDVCPTTLATMNEALDRLGPDAGRVQVLFVTIDPERDTPQLLAEYVPQFRPGFIGLHGDAATTAAVAKEFRVFYAKQAGSSPAGYSIDHTAGAYVFDPQGRLRLYLRHGETAQNVADDLRLLLAGK